MMETRRRVLQGGAVFLLFVSAIAIIHLFAFQQVSLVGSNLSNELSSISMIVFVMVAVISALVMLVHSWRRPLQHVRRIHLKNVKPETIRVDSA